MPVGRAACDVVVISEKVRAQGVITMETGNDHWSDKGTDGAP